MKHFAHSSLVVMFSALLLVSLGACKKTATSPESVTSEVSDGIQQTDTEKINEDVDRAAVAENANPANEAQVDWKSRLIDQIEVYNPSFTSRPPKEAFYNQVEVTINGIHTQAAVVKAAIQSEEEMECVNSACGSTIHFDNAAIPPAYVDQTLNLSISNLGDLDGDGSDEIGALPDWWSSNIHTYKILTFKNGQWRRLVPSPTVHLEVMYEHPYVPAEKIPGKPDFILIREYDSDKAEVVESEVKIPKL